MDTIRKIILFPEALYYAIIQGKMPLHILIGLIMVFVLFLALLYIFLLAPIIFNYFLIPEIEKKTGKKLEDHPLIRCLFMGRFSYRCMMVAVYDVNRHIAYLRAGERGVPKKGEKLGPNYPLSKIGYTIDIISKRELICSYLLIISLILSIVFGIVIACIGQIYNPSA